jgi:hypothetical protein
MVEIAHIFSLSNRTYRYLFMVLIIALIGTGLATVALGLLAGDRAGESGTALAMKMLAYILVAPVADALCGPLFISPIQDFTFQPLHPPGGMLIFLYRCHCLLRKAISDVPDV